MTSDDPRRAKIAEVAAKAHAVHAEGVALSRVDRALLEAVELIDELTAAERYHDAELVSVRRRVDELTAEVERLTAAQALSADLARRCILSDDESLAEDSIDLLKLIQPGALCGSTDHGRTCEQLRGHGGMHRGVGGTWK